MSWRLFGLHSLTFTLGENHLNMLTSMNSLADMYQASMTRRTPVNQVFGTEEVHIG
jgi:hypothetical protein